MSDAASRVGRIRGLLGLRAWLVGLIGLPIQVCYFALFYLGLRTGEAFPVQELLLLVLSLWLYLSFIVLINDLADREVDAAVGKATVERGHALGRRTIAAILVLMVALNGLTVVLMGRGLVFDALWVLAYALGTLYSLPPLSLKRRGVWGFLADSLMEKPLPVLIVFAFFGYFGFEAVLFPVLGELLDSVFKHQQRDFELDVATGLRTFAVTIGKRLSTRVVERVIHPADAVLVLLGFVAVALEIAWLRLFALASLLCLALVVGYAFLRLRSAVFRSEEIGWVDPPYITLFNAWFQIVLITGLGVAAAVGSIVYLPMLVLFLASTFPYLRYYAELARRLFGGRGLGGRAQEVASRTYAPRNSAE